MNRIAKLGIALLIAFSLISCGQTKGLAITQDELVRRTQELMDSVAPGNQEPWKKYYADDATYFDEKGRAMDKAALVKDVSPMPTGYSGSIKVLNPRSHIFADTAILSYDLDETETIFGNNMKARYHGTDTWMFRNGQWQIVAGQMLRYYEDPAATELDTKRVREYLGKYELAPGTTREVTYDGRNVYVQRTGRDKELLTPEAPDIFFRKGVEGRILFPHSDGQPAKVLIDRRNNEDVIWKRVK
jgi:hypothetical protein